MILVMVNCRRVHLDFHTSEYIEKIGDKFDKNEFQNTLKNSAVSQITLFAKCHHGWCYYPTKVGTMHPNLSFDLLGAQIEACKEIGVKVVVYITGGWSVKDSLDHPDWRAISFDTKKVAYMEDGAVVNRTLSTNSDDPRPNCSWDLMCLSGNYRQHILDLTEEVCDRYPQIDGLFYDICCLDIPCICDACTKNMKQKGINIDDRKSVLQYMIDTKKELMSDCKKIMDKKLEHGSIFFNSGGADINHPFYMENMTHFEIEDLPTVGGYNNIYNRAKFFLKRGKDVIGMTGKFRHTWGEFGSYKKPEALKYECATMLSLGLECSIGDQLHPDGKIDQTTYNEIGYAYNYIKQIEDYCYDCDTTSRLGLVLSNNWSSGEGVTAMLIDSQIDYEICEEQDNLGELYDCIILVNDADISSAFADKLKEFVDNGGSLITIAKAGLKNNNFIIPTCVKFISDPIYDMDYIVANEKIKSKDIVSPLLAYKACNITEMLDESEVLAGVEQPYFKRTVGKYCSHRNTPNDRLIEKYPAICKKNNLIYFAHDFGTMYLESGDLYLREIFISTLKTVYNLPFEVDGLMSCGRARLVRRDNKLFLHLLYAAPINRGNVILLEDFPTLYNIKVDIKGYNANKIIERPVNEEITFSNNENGVCFTVPKLKCHTLIEIEYS